MRVHHLERRHTAKDGGRGHWLCLDAAEVGASRVVVVAAAEAATQLPRAVCSQHLDIHHSSHHDAVAVVAAGDSEVAVVAGGIL